MSKKNRADAAMAQGRVIYMLELARGSSHIASTRKPETRDRAIAEVLEGFVEVHGLQRLDIFRELLAEDTDRRGHLEAAAAVRHFGRALPDTAKKNAGREGPAQKDSGHCRGARNRPEPERRGVTAGVSGQEPGTHNVQVNGAGAQNGRGDNHIAGCDDSGPGLARRTRTDRSNGDHRRAQISLPNHRPSLRKMAARRSSTDVRQPTAKDRSWLIG